MSNRGRITDHDKFIGAKLAELRIMKGLSQAKCAKLLNVSIQQFQKYEKAVNRMPITYMFKLCKEWNIKSSYFNSDEENDNDFQCMFDPQTIKLNKCFHRIQDTDIKNKVLEFVELMSK